MTKGADNYNEMTKSVVGAPVKSWIRILFCCKVEASPFVGSCSEQVIISSILLLDVVRWVLLVLLTVDLRKVLLFHARSVFLSFSTARVSDLGFSL